MRKDTLKKIVKRTGILLLFALIVIQFIRPVKNEDSSASLEKIQDEFSTPEDVLNILESSCNDCHSNFTFYPWYAEIQPMGWWISNHVNEGKEHLNFDIFRSYAPDEQHHAMEELIETVQEDEMPMPSYTYLHGNAVLDAGKKAALITWAQGIMRELEKNHPALKEEGEVEKED